MAPSLSLASIQLFCRCLNEYPSLSLSLPFPPPPPSWDNSGHLWTAKLRRKKKSTCGSANYSLLHRQSSRFEVPSRHMITLERCKILKKRFEQHSWTEKLEMSSRAFGDLIKSLMIVRDIIVYAGLLMRCCSVTYETYGLYNGTTSFRACANSWSMN